MPVVAGRYPLVRVLAAIVVVYLLLLGLMFRWHWLHGPPHTQATGSLLVALALCATLVGLSSIVMAFAALHWTRRVAGVVAGAAVVDRFWTEQFAWNGFLIWQMLVILAVQTVTLGVVLGLASWLGSGLTRPAVTGIAGEAPARSSRAMQLSITDFLILAAALALLCAVLRDTQPIDMPAWLYSILVAGGVCAATVALAVLWTCFGRAPILLRGTALALVAPTGGAVHAVAGRSIPLLFNAPWYAGVTTAQVAFMMIPCLVLRSHGYRFGSGSRGAVAPEGR